MGACKPLEWPQVMFYSFFSPAITQDRNVLSMINVTFPQSYEPHCCSFKGISNTEHSVEIKK